MGGGDRIDSWLDRWRILKGLNCILLITCENAKRLGCMAVADNSVRWIYNSVNARVFMDIADLIDAQEMWCCVGTTIVG